MLTLEKVYGGLLRCPTYTNSKGYFCVPRKVFGGVGWGSLTLEGPIRQATRLPEISEDPTEIIYVNYESQPRTLLPSFLSS